MKKLFIIASMLFYFCIDNTAKYENIYKEGYSHKSHFLLLYEDKISFKIFIFITESILIIKTLVIIKTFAIIKTLICEYTDN